MYHAMAQTILCTIALTRAVPVYIRSEYDYATMLQDIKAFRITDLTLVPPIVSRMAKDPLVQAGRYDLSTVERVKCGGAPLGREIRREFETLWPINEVNVKQAWGMTEVTCSVIGRGPRKPSSDNAVGELHASCEAKSWLTTERLK